MSKTELLINAFDERVTRRNERRKFFKTAGGFAVGATAGAVLGACSSSSDTAVAQNPPAGAVNLDVEILNFALQLEYLEAQFYSYAAFGTGLPQSSLTGTGTQGAVIGGRQVNFTDPLVRRYANEIAQDEIAHVTFLRTALGGSAVAQPAIDVGTSPTGAFSNAARAAGLVGPGVAFDPYLNDNNFLLGAFIFEDVGVTAYKGAAPLLTSKTFLEASAGLLAVEAYHAGLVRTVLTAKGLETPTQAISNARDSLDGASDLDQGITATGTGNAAASNIVPTDANGLAYSRSVAQVLNIVYLNATSGTTTGGFFPAGLNGPAAFRTT